MTTATAARVMHGDISRCVDDDGRVWFNSDQAAELLLRGFDLTHLNILASSETETYNTWCEKKDKAAYAIRDRETANANNRLDSWFITDKFRELPVRAAVLERCTTDAEINRCNQELDLFEDRGLFPVLRLMFMLVDHFRRNNIIWGVGRGSSVSSFVLYKIGVHRLNPMTYGLEISEFLRD